MLLTAALISSLCAAAPAHPWANLPKGAWVQYQLGSDKGYFRGSMTVAGLKGSMIDVQGDGAMAGSSGAVDVGLEAPGASPTRKILRKEALTVGKVSFDCEVVEWSGKRTRITHWLATGQPLPIKETVDPINGNEAAALEWTAVETSVPLYIGGKKLLTVRYDGSSAGKPMRRWLSPEVPGWVVLQERLDANGALQTVKLVEAFGLKGTPPGAALAAGQWHPWASFQPGAWVKTRTNSPSNVKEPVTESKTALKAADRLSFTLVGVNHSNPLGTLSAMADPTSTFVSGVGVKIGEAELPCLLYTFKGKDQAGELTVQSDCVSPFARVPIYTERKTTIFGVTATDSLTAITLEEPVQIGKRTVYAVSRRGKQKLSNGGQSAILEQLSADVPGGTVRSEWKSDPEKLGSVAEVLEFGLK